MGAAVALLLDFAVDADVVFAVGCGGMEELLLVVVLFCRVACLLASAA